VHDAALSSVGHIAAFRTKKSWRERFPLSRNTRTQTRLREHAHSGARGYTPQTSVSHIQPCGILPIGCSYWVDSTERAWATPSVEENGALFSRDVLLANGSLPFFETPLGWKGVPLSPFVYHSLIIIMGSGILSCRQKIEAQGIHPLADKAHRKY
jgi:hypothetical protein